VLLFFFFFSVDTITRIQWNALEFCKKRYCPCHQGRESDLKKKKQKNNLSRIWRPKPHQKRRKLWHRNQTALLKRNTNDNVFDCIKHDENLTRISCTRHVCVKRIHRPVEGFKMFCDAVDGLIIVMWIVTIKISKGRAFGDGNSLDFVCKQILRGREKMVSHRNWRKLPKKKKKKKKRNSFVEEKNDGCVLEPTRIDDFIEKFECFFHAVDRFIFVQN
jgi:hypothetical protein